jgi:hypothetical protein
MAVLQMTNKSKHTKINTAKKSILKIYKLQNLGTYKDNDKLHFLQKKIQHLVSIYLFQRMKGTSPVANNTRDANLKKQVQKLVMNRK